MAERQDESGTERRARALRERAEEEVEWRKREAASRGRSVSYALETAADALVERGERRLADYARIAAERVDRVTDHVKDRDTRGLVGELQDVARSHPASFVGGSFAAGLALGRFLHAGDRRARDMDRVDRAEIDREPAAGAAAPRPDRAPDRLRERSPDAIGGAERPGVRTGGVAMAGRAAGSGREATGRTAGPERRSGAL